MKKLRTRYERWLLAHRDRGIPHLMLYIGLGNILVYFISMLTNSTALYSALCFDAQKLLHGQVWRLASYVFTYAFSYSGSMIDFIYLMLSVYFYWWLGKMLEDTWGTLRFDLYYGGGILLTSIVGALIWLLFKLNIYVTPYYVNLSLFLAVATLIPEQRVLVFFVIPVKMRWMALIDIGLTVMQIAQYLVYYRPFWTALLVFGTAAILAFVNYALVFGRDAANLLPNRRPRRPRTAYRPTPYSEAPRAKKTAPPRPYRHKCTVCGRTDIDCPDLEFRYCSKCKGYFCYCIDHIDNHTHVV